MITCLCCPTIRHTRGLCNRCYHKFLNNKKGILQLSGPEAAERFEKREIDEGHILPTKRPGGRPDAAVNKQLWGNPLT